MKNGNIGVEIAKPLQDLLVEAERFNEIFTENLAHLKEDSKDILKALPRITLEIEQLKKTRENLSAFLAEKMKATYLKENQEFFDRLSTEFLEKTEKGLQAQKKEYEASLKTIQDTFHDQIEREKQEIKQALGQYDIQAQETAQKYLNDAQILKQEMTGVVSSMTRLMNLQKQRLTRKGVLICAVFCVVSVLTGGGLFYFFPQNIYYYDGNTARNMIMGRSTWDNMKHLSVKDQTLLLDGMKKYMDKK